MKMKTICNGNYTHHINEEKHVVACVRERNGMSDDNVLARLARKSMPAAFATAMFAEKSLKTAPGTTVLGIAKCHEKDEFDEDLGRYIASGRADIKHHADMIADLGLIKDRMLAEIEQLDKMIAKAEGAKDHSAGVVQSLCDGTHE